MAVLVDELMAYVERYGLRIEDRRGTVRDYVLAMQDVPADLMALAVRRLKTQWRWRSMPTPGDLRRQIDDDLAGRRLDLLRLQTASRRRQASERPLGEPPRPETIRRLQEALAAMGRRQAAVSDDDELSDRGIEAAKRQVLDQIEEGATAR